MTSEIPSGPDPTLYLYTSLTAGSSHIITATSRLETILKANKIAFRAIDCATDEKARSLWGRRSKGRKIPGLVKYGQVIGDLEEVEEWNEYGEIKENIDNVSDVLGDTPMTDTPMPPPAPITLKDPLAKATDPPSRASSESRHISISEPKDKDSPASSARTSRDETPMAMAMRQAGAEAAAKAGQKKASASLVSKSSATASALPAKSDNSETVPTASAMKMSVEAEDPADATTITAGKTPAQLALEGAKKTSIGKIAENSENESLSTSDSESEKSTEEQVLEKRRNSSIAKRPSRLHQETNVDEVKTTSPEQAVTSDTNLPSTVSKSTGAPPQHHRGSSLSQASAEEIKEIEAKNAIKEETEEEEEDDDDDEDDSSDDEKPTKSQSPAMKSKIQATDEAEAAVTKGTKTQDQKATDGEAAGVSAAAALFLSPNHDPNPNRLSADSASVYSFFDSAFSPAPLFSGAQTLDLNLSFIQDVGKTNVRDSVSSYGTERGEDKSNSVASETNGTSHDETPRQSEDTQRSIRDHPEPDDSPGRDMLPSMPTIAPLRTPARRQVSDPLFSTSDKSSVATPTSVPLPLTIRKSPTNTHSPSISNSSSQSRPATSQSRTTTQQTPQPTRSQPLLQTQSSSKSLSQSQPQLLTSSTSTITSPISPSPSSATATATATASPSPSTPTTPQSASTSRSLRFKKSLRSLRSKKSTQRLDPNSPSPTKEAPPDLPPQIHLKNAMPMGRSVSDSYAVKQGRKERGGEKSGMKNLLCF